MVLEGHKGDKLEFTAESETPGYTSLHQARVLMIQHGRDNREIYRHYADRELVWEVASGEETEHNTARPPTRDTSRGSEQCT